MDLSLDQTLRTACTNLGDRGVVPLSCGKAVYFRRDAYLPISAGDVVFVLQEQPHAEFKRKGDDLYIERSISLTEALCGFSMEVR